MLTYNPAMYSSIIFYSFTG